MIEKNNNSAVILDGRKMAENIKAELFRQISKEEGRPGLAAILIGDDPASQLYVEIKERACLQTDIRFHKYLCSEKCYSHASEEEIIDMIKFLNKDESIDGILVQLPLPEKYDTQKIINAIDSKKDVDGFHYGTSEVISPVVGAIMELIKAVPDLKTENKKTLTLIKNETFANSLEEQLKNIGLTDITHENKIPENSTDYDVIIIALGQTHILKKSMVKEGCIIIDVGINKTDGKTAGDVDPQVAEVAGYLSPVPGGVGPLTVACLLKNTYQLFKNKK